MSQTSAPRVALPSVSGGIDLLFVAGEHSGDAHAAEALRELRQTHPELRVAAVGGRELKNAGATLLFDLTAHSVVGLFEVLRHYGFFKALMAAVGDWIAAHQPALVCTVDYPGFNLRLAKRLGEAGISRKGGGAVGIVQYISPQLWAWKGHRRFAMAKWLDGLAAIFPFEAAVYADTALPVTVVQHPLVQPGATARFRQAPDGPLLLLPGSRLQPVQRIFPRMLATVRRLRASGASFEVRALYPSAALGTELERLCEAAEVPCELVPVDQGLPHPARAALMSSGTVSLEVALAAIPGRLMYVAHPLTYRIGRALVRVPYLGMANLLLGHAAWPEFIQQAASPATLADELAPLIANGDAARSEQDVAQKAAERLRQLLRGRESITPGAWLASWFGDRC
ncbi:MAG: lipid-A-disaccharide synthase [Opitutales bacterium]